MRKLCQVMVISCDTALCNDGGVAPDSNSLIGRVCSQLALRYRQLIYASGRNRVPWVGWFFYLNEMTNTTSKTRH